MFSRSIKSSVSFLALTLSCVTSDLVAMGDRDLTERGSVPRKAVAGSAYDPMKEGAWESLQAKISSIDYPESILREVSDAVYKPGRFSFSRATFHFEIWETSFQTPGTPETRKALLRILMTEAQGGHENARETLYKLLTKENSDIEDRPLAEVLLQQGVKDQQEWAFKARYKASKQQEDLIAYYTFCAQRGDQKAEEQLNRHYGYVKEKELKTIQDYASKLSPKTLKMMKNLLDPLFKKWIGIGYSAPLRDACKIVWTCFSPSLSLTYLDRAFELLDAPTLSLCARLQAEEGNYSEALRYSLKAADLCHWPALGNAVALMVEGRVGITPDPLSALGLCLKAAESAKPGINLSVVLSYIPNIIQTQIAAFKKGSFTVTYSPERLPPYTLPPEPEKMLELFTKAIDWIPSPELWGLLGEFFERGFQGLEPEPHKAFELYLAAKTEGYNEAAVGAGFLLRKSFKGWTPDLPRSLELCRLVADTGNFLAMSAMGNLCAMDGKDDEALEWYSRSAPHDPRAALKAAEIIFQGVDNHPAGAKAASDFLRPFAHMHENTEIWCLMGTFLAEVQELEEAKVWYLKAAERGDFFAACGAGRLSQSTEEAVVWFEKALTLNPEDINTIVNLAFSYSPLDLNKSNALYEKAANLGDVESMFFMVAHYFMKGDLYRAFEWCTKVIKQEKMGKYYLLALHNKAYIIAQGKNKEKALELWYQAAKRDHIPSMKSISDYHLNNPKSTSENLSEAEFWLQRAASLGDTGARNLLSKLEESPSGDEEDAALIQVLETLSQFSTMDDLPASRATRKPWDSQKLLEKKVSEDDWDDISDDEAGSSSEVPLVEEEIQDAGSPATESSKPIVNPKYVRAMMKTAARQREETVRRTVETRPSELSKPAQVIAHKILTKKGADTVSSEDLDILFRDPYFGDQVTISDTKSGIQVIAKSLNTFDYRTAGTHRNHDTGNYKGFHRKFLDKIFSILTEMFGVTVEMTQTR